MITKLCDDEVVTDARRDLLIALKCFGVINGAEMVDLLGRHLSGLRSIIRLHEFFRVHDQDQKHP